MIFGGYSSRCQLKLKQFHFEFLEGGSAQRIQIPRGSHHVVNLGRTALGRLHFVADLDVFDDVGERLKFIKDTMVKHSLFFSTRKSIQICNADCELM